jgi:hypothetical protein
MKIGQPSSRSLCVCDSKIKIREIGGDDTICDSDGLSPWSRECRVTLLCLDT